jgi:hypothetical protein
VKPSLAPPLPEELTNNISCDEMAVLKVQSDRVNVRVAAQVADYLYRMAAGNLKRFVTYFGLESRMARSARWKRYDIKSVGIRIIHLSLPFLCLLYVLCGLIIPIQSELI